MGYELLPNPGMFTHLLVLVRDRHSIFESNDSNLEIATKFLLTGEILAPSLQVTQNEITLRSLFSRLIDHVFLSELPDCTPEQLAHSIDRLSDELVPPIPIFKTFESEEPHALKQRFDTIPSRDWFRHVSHSEYILNHYPSDHAFVETRNRNSHDTSLLAEKQSQQTRMMNSATFRSLNRKSPDFWLEVFTTP